MDEYAEVFDVRGHKYDAAMRAFPHARDAEFIELFRGLDINGVRQVYDIPSGGGYLRPFLPAGTELTAYDPSADFGTSSAQRIDLENPDLPTAGADLAVSLAALHHVANKRGFFDAALNAVRSGGWFCVGDVAAGSGIADFLDKFVGAHNGMGHSGVYLDPAARWYNEAAGDNAELLRCEVSPCPWRFSNEADLAKFCGNLFGLQGVAQQLLIDTLASKVGLGHSGSDIVLEWELLYLQYHVTGPDTNKPPSS